MKISERGRDLIVQFEGLRLEAYPDPGTNGSPWTIGIGSTQPEVKPGDVITTDEAYRRFDDDIAPAEAAVNSLVKVLITQSQFDALVSFVFNVGAGAFKDSTLLRLLNEGKYREVGPQFDRWNKAGNTVLLGLVKRRAAERKLFESGIA